MWSLIGGIKGFIYIAIFLAVVGWAANKTYQLDKVEKARDVAISERDLAAAARDKAISVAKDNERTISILKQEKENINSALSTLETAKNNNRVVSSARASVITSSAKVPANAAIAAPVLGNLIEEIQIDRTRRRGTPVGATK